MYKIFIKFIFRKKIPKIQGIKDLLDEAKKTCLKLSTTELNQLQISNYKYEANEAIEELGITSELVHQLVEDYVAQIIKSELHFLKILNELNPLNKSIYRTLFEKLVVFNI